MKRKKIATFLLLVLTPGMIFADRLSLDEFLTQIEQNHPFFNKEALRTEIPKTQQKALLGAEDWQINATTTFSHENFGTNNAFSVKQANYANLDVSLSRTYWKTGGQLSAAYSLARSSQDYAQGNVKTYQNDVKLQYMHPLLKNVNGILSRLNYDLQDYNIQNSEINALEAKENFLAELGDKYLDWRLQTELVRINEERLVISDAELSRSQRKRANNLVPKVESFVQRPLFCNHSKACNRPKPI